MKSKNIKSASSISMLILYGILILALLFLTLIGCRLYNSFTESRIQNEKSRAACAYIQSKVSSLDSKGAVVVQKGFDGQSDMLVLREEENSYETRIFISQGKLMELFTQKDEKTDLTKAETITDEKTLSLELRENGKLLQVTTQEGRFAVAIRSGQGGSDEREK